MNSYHIPLLDFWYVIFLLNQNIGIELDGWKSKNRYSKLFVRSLKLFVLSLINMETNGDASMGTNIATPRRRLEFGGNDINGRHATIPDEKIPKKGMEFDSDEAAYDFYNKYAELVGFSVRKQNSHIGLDKVVLDRTLCCSWEGYRKKDKRDIIVKRPRRITRNGCLAMIRINARHTGKYVVEEFVAAHNGRDLATPKKSHLLRSHRSMNVAQISQADDIDSSGITPKSGFELMVQQVGGREKVGFILQDYKNYLRTKRTIQMETSDTGGVLEYLQGRQQEDPNFYYAIHVDVDGLIANIFWADAQMMVDYGFFGDVVSFDTTYRKNKADRPFALFVGINHHKQTTLFGAALLYDETIPSFEWLFETFSKVMSGKIPQTILTDQDPAMASALETKWPGTYHRLCIWHIYQNAATHLATVFANHADFGKDFSSCIYDHDEEEDFVEAWERMLVTYDLQTNGWLNRLYGFKEKWALVYGRQKFCGEMSTTQRSESMNSVLRRYVNSKHDILRFIQHFQRLVDDRRNEELQADFWTSQSTPVLSFPVRLLKHAVSVYTHEIFSLFQRELSKAHDSKEELCNINGEISEYRVTWVSLAGKHYHHMVSFNSSTSEVSCSCNKFEFAGFLCSHALHIFRLKSITRIPEIYIMKRWTKFAKRGLCNGQFFVPSSGSFASTDKFDEQRLIGARHKELSQIFKLLGTRGALTSECYEIVRSHALKALEEIDACLEKSTSSDSSFQPKSAANVSRVVTKKNNKLKVSDNISTDAATDEVVIRGLKVKKREKGKSSKRPLSGLEKATRTRKGKKVSKDLKNGEDCTSIEPNTLASLPYIQFSSQPSQDVQVDTSNMNLSMYCPAQGYPSSHIMPLQNLQEDQVGMCSSSIYLPTQGHPSFLQLLQEQTPRQEKY